MEEKKSFEYWAGYLKGVDEEIPRRLKVESIANEVAELLTKKDLSCGEVKEILHATQDFINQCTFTSP